MKFKRCSITLIGALCFASAFSADQEWSHFLKEHSLSLGVALQQFDYEFHNQLFGRMSARLTSESILLNAGESRWLIMISADSAPDRDQAMDFRVSFRCVAGQLPSANVAMQLEFQNWSTENYVLMPACVYDGNRFESRRIRYSPKLVDSRDCGVNAPMIISDVPRLNNRSGLSRLSLRSGDLSAPAVGIRFASNGQGVLLCFSQGNHLGDYGLVLEESRNRDRAILSLTSPVVREEYQYFIADNQHESRDTPMDFAAGDSVVISVRLECFDAYRIQDVFDQMFDLWDKYWEHVETKPAFSLSSCFSVIEKKFNQQNFVPEFGYYSVGSRENFLQDWQIGWTGGMISTYPLLFAGDDRTKSHVLRNFDWLFPAGLCPAGFFWDAGEKGTIWYGGDVRKGNTKDWHLIRKSCDALYYIIKQFWLMDQLGIPLKASWVEGTRTVADALVRLWQRYGQFGQFVNSQSGNIEVGGSTSAALAPAALILAGKFYGDSSYFDVAQQSGEWMYQNYVIRGITCGGPGDALQNPDSESSYAMLESFMLLYDHTGDSLWLHRAKEMAHQFATWVMPYNYRFPANSFMGKLGLQTFGTVWANTQNKHAAPGICTHSGIALLRLYRASGDQRYLDLLRHIVRAIPQYLSHPLRPIPGMPPGWVSERVNTTDWLEGIGEPFIGSTWSETSLMLSFIEIPGLYIVPEYDLVVAFDQINASIIGRNKHSLNLVISNPTATEAQIKVFIEHQQDLRQPLPENYLLAAKVITMAAGEKKRLTIKKRIIQD
ncbi:MAG: hypothetical protein ONB37_18440 [candidate division KSB1 bacterium]|nr:hypothetical protein [candidate division KSB1 bacterium]